MNKEELKKVLDDHAKWLNNGRGERADLRGADLRGANFGGADLEGANLGRADLRRADLEGVNLGRADLRGADLEGANLRGADLRGADLEGANLGRADLRGANLEGANLGRADLRGANLGGAKLPHFQIPQHGELRVYKKVNGKIIHLLIPAWAKRTASLIGRKCRASAAIVLAIQGNEPQSSAGSGYGSILYEIGKTVYPDSYDPDIRVECSHGIHFFLTREEAEEWNG